uniref:Uncharacterized protein n=1 Tax=Arundo donax TaxID=35708 RepID=A0A0A9FWF8_ARUDO
MTLESICWRSCLGLMACHLRMFMSVGVGVFTFVT